MLCLPELKVVKPNDTRWLSHERCVQADAWDLSERCLGAMTNLWKLFYYSPKKAEAFEECPVSVVPARA